MNGRKNKKNLTIKQQKPPPHAMNNTDNNLRQTYLKDCDCTNGGIIIHDGEAVCRWCLTPYAEGGCISYPDERFPQSKLKEQQPISNDRVEVTTCGHANWNEPNGGAFIFKTNKPIRYNDFPSEKIKQAIEAVLNGDTVVEDDIVGLLRDCVSSTWGNPSLDRTQELFDKFLLDRKLVNPTLKDVNKTVTKLVNEILLDKKYSQSEVDTIRKESFDAGRNHNGTPKYGFVVWEYPTLQDYLNSLSKETKPKEEDKPVLFTTEDGVDVCSNDVKCYCVYPNDCKIQMVYASRNELSNMDWKRFNVKENAERWLIENKPCLSLNDLLEVWTYNPGKGEIIMNADFYKRAPLYKNFEQKAKQKLKQ